MEVLLDAFTRTFQRICHRYRKNRLRIIALTFIYCLQVAVYTAFRLLTLNVKSYKVCIDIV